MIFRGRINWIGTKETFTKADGSAMSKVNFVVEEESDKEYKDSIMLDMFGDKADSFINGYKVGDLVSVTFGWRVRDYTNKDWVAKKIGGLTAIRVELEASAPAASATGGKLRDPVEDQNDDMPF